MVTIFLLSIFSKEFRCFKAEYDYYVPDCPELFYEDGERIFTEKEKYYLEILRAG